MRIIESEITKRKLSDGTKIWCDALTTRAILHKVFPATSVDKPILLGPLSVVGMDVSRVGGEDDTIFLLEGSTDPKSGVEMILFIGYSGRKGEIEAACLASHFGSPSFWLDPAAIPLGEISKKVMDHTIQKVMNSEKPTNPGLSNSPSNDFFPDLNMQPTPGVTPTWDSRFNV